MPNIKLPIALAAFLALAGCTSTEIYPVHSAESRAQFSRDYEAGYRYQHGIGVPQNYELAASAYRRAEKAGDVRAMNNLGVMALRGQLGGFGGAGASGYFSKAAKAGSSNGYYNLALLQEVGRGKPDYAGALRNYKIAAEMGNAAAQIRLAQMYQSGIAVPADPSVAKSYFDMAAMAGNSEAVEKMKAVHGRTLTESDIARLVGSENCGCENPSQKAMAGRAMVDLKELADKGDAPARYNLGVRYLNGAGAPKNASEAARYFTTAARQGYAPAQRQLAQMHLRGEGVAPSKILAHAWLNLAARSTGTDSADARAEMQKLELSMTFSEIKEAQSLAQSGAFRGR